MCPERIHSHTLIHFQQFVGQIFPTVLAKLNFRKPECASVVYSPLTEEQEAETEKIASFLKPYMKPECKAFDFFARKNRNIPNHEAPKANGLRMLHGYLTSCGAVFLVE